jgi:translocation and assembly module TamB
MKKLIKKTIYGSLLLLVLLICLLSFFLTSTPGLYTAIKLGALYLPGTLKVHKLNGRLLDNFSIGELSYQNKHTTIKIKQIQVNWQLLSIIQGHLPIKNLNADTLDINQVGKFTRFKKIKITGLYNQQGLKCDSLRFNYLDQPVSSHMQIETKAPYKVSGSIKINPYSQSPKILKGTINISGDLNQLTWTGEFQGPGEISLKGNLDQLSQFKLTSKWRNLLWQKSPASTFNSPEGTLKISGILPHLNMELTAKVNKSSEENWQLVAHIKGAFPWHWNFDANLSQPLDPSSKREGLYTNLTAKGIIKDSNEGSMELTVHPGHYQTAKNSLVSSLKFQGGVLKTSLSPQRLSGNGTFGIDDNKKIKVHFKLPKFNLNKGLSNSQPISAELSLLLNSFDFLQDLSPEISKPTGQLTASLITTGTLGKTNIESKLTLSKASLVLPKLGLNLDSIELIALGKKQHWSATGSVVSAGKKIKLKGQGPLGSSLNGDITLQGADFPLMNTKEYQINISPQLNINFAASNMNITGSIIVPFAKIKPHTFANSITLSEDVVIQSKLTKNDTPPSPLFSSNMNIRVEMGNKVELSFKGLNATLGGTVTLKQVPLSPISALGELSVIKGTYKAYGQDLAIEQGQLIFTGGGLDNPGINLRASKIIDTTTASTAGTSQPFDFSSNNLKNTNVRGNITVGVEVSGRLTEPKILLFSNPAILSQADILSMLVLGRPANQANKAGGQLLLAAISSMNLGNGTNGTQLLEQLKKNLGFDVNVETTSNYNIATNQISDSTAVVVGKSISKRIYLSYNVGLSQADPNVVTLKYLLNKFYSIQVSNSTTANAIDILYTSSAKGKK